MQVAVCIVDDTGCLPVIGRYPVLAFKLHNDS